MAGSPTQAKFKPTASAEQADATQLLSGLQTKTSKTMFLVPTSSLPPRCPGIAHTCCQSTAPLWGLVQFFGSPLRYSAAATLTKRPAGIPSLTNFWYISECLTMFPKSLHDQQQQEEEGSLNSSLANCPSWT